MTTQHRRTGTSITDAVYPRRGKGPRKPPAAPKRPVSPRHGFRLADQLDADVRAKLERFAAKHRKGRS